MDRGFGRCFVIKKFMTSIKKYPNGTGDRTIGPAPASKFQGGENDPKYKRQQYLDPDGICQVGEVIESNSVLVNKESPAATEGEFKPSSLSYKGATRATVDKVLLAASSESQDMTVKVSILYSMCMYTCIYMFVCTRLLLIYVYT